MHYALTDTFTGNDPCSYEHGFANTKVTLAFRTRAERDGWVDSTRLLTAKALTRDEALQHARTDHNGNKIAKIYRSENHHIIKKSRRNY